MPTARLDGIETRYEILGDGPPLLLFSPGGFDATVEKWSTLGVYARVKPVEALARHFRCIAYDRRECGQSGGKVEPITWKHYADQGRALLDHLGVERAALMGGCMGVSAAIAFAVACPERVSRMVLWWPVGGARYRIKGHQRFSEHIEFARARGLAAVAELVQREGKAFGADPRGGPWASVLRRDADFARAYAAQELAGYLRVVEDMAKGLLDRDTAPGAEPEALMRLDIPALIVPGRDESHATSAARYLEECLEGSRYWDAPPEAQTAESAQPRLIEFLGEAFATT